MTKSYKLLIADPDERYLESIGNYLTQNGFSVIKVQTGKQAFQFALKVDPDLCLLDSQLEDVNGFAVCRSIRKKRPNLPVIVCSSIYKGADNLRKAKQKFLATDLIEKPCTDADMLKRIRNSLSATTGVRKSHAKANSLEEKLEQTLSGLDLSSLTQKKKKKVEQSTSATIQVNTEELRRELSKLRTGKPAGQNFSGKPQFKVGSAAKKKDGNAKLSSKDIFGDLISDIERGVKKRKPAPQVASESIPAPARLPDKVDLKPRKEVAAIKPAAPVTPKPPVPPVIVQEPKPVEAVLPDDGFLLEEPNIDALPGFGESDKSEPDSSDSKANDYELLEKIAAGGMAEVWKARLKGEKGFEKIVAIKKILPHLSDNEEFITMFIDEAKVAANLTHPNIAQIYELGKFGDTFFIAMEYVSGRNLRTILNYCMSVNVRIPSSIVVYIGVKLCNALEYAHRKKDHTKNEPLHIVHRDISPQNILISVEGEIKLVDFGIAKATIKAANTVAGSLKGKLLYMSPEQAEGKSIDHRSDIFSLGNLLYESLTGCRLVDGDSELSILKKVRECDFKNPRELNPDIPVKLERIILKALKKEPNDRYSNARDMEKELKAYMKTEKLHVTESDVIDFLQHIDEKDNKKINDFELTRAQTGKESVILPDSSEVRKFEKESLVGIGSKKKVPWTWVAIIGLPIIAIILYLGYKSLWPMNPEPIQLEQTDVQMDPVPEQPVPAEVEQAEEVETASVLPEQSVTLSEEDKPQSESGIDSSSINTSPSEEAPVKAEEETEQASASAAPGPATDEVPSQQVDASEQPAASEVPVGESQPTADGSDETSVEEILEQMKALQAERAKKQKKLLEFKKANNLSDEVNKKEPK